jgi:hypothetical protein
MLWKERTQEEIDEIIEKTAQMVVDKDLVEPALLFFHSYKPLAPVGGRLGGAAFAWLIPLLGHTLDDYFVAFREYENVERVQKLIEEKASKKKADNKKNN